MMRASRRPRVAGGKIASAAPEGLQRPLRLPQPLRPAYLLNYDWTGWPTSGTALPSATAETVRATSSAWETDVVLVVAERFRITNPELLGRVRDGAMAGAEEEGHRIVALSVMPDHTYGVAGEF